MKEPFEKLKDELIKLHFRLFKGYLHFQVWNAIKNQMAPNLVGEEKANQNVKTINRYKGFFSPTIEAHKKIFALELAKFYDLDKQSLSIVKIINFARSNIKKLTVTEFEDFNKGRPLLDSLIENYSGVSEELLKECENILLQNGLELKSGKSVFILDSPIEKLKYIRDKYISHNQIKVLEKTMSIEEFENLFQVTSELLNKIYYALNHSTFAHFIPSKPANVDTEKLLEKLQVIV